MSYWHTVLKVEFIFGYILYLNDRKERDYLTVSIWQSVDNGNGEKRKFFTFHKKIFL